MNVRQLAVSAGAALLLGTAAIPAFAATISVGGASGVSATGVANTNTNVTTGVSAGASQTGVNVTGNTGVTGSSSASGNTGVSTSASGSATVSVSLTSASPAVVNFSGAMPTASDAMAVQTQDQLNAYATGVLHNDANVQNVNSSNSTVSLSYKKPGHFLGFIPMHITEQATADASGDVTFTYPWYHFLVSTNDNVNAQTTAESDIQSVASKTSGSLSAQAQAQIMADLYMGMASQS